MGFLEKAVYKPIAIATANYLKSQARQDFEKANSSGQVGPAIRRSSLDQNNVNSPYRKRPGSDVTFETLRSFAKRHEISRICINARKRQITQLGWEIAPADPEDKTNYSKDIENIKAYFKNLGGYRMRFRELQDMMIEDLLTLDAICLYKDRIRAGDIQYYLPVDPVTIRLRVDETGGTPEPPETAYQQVIRGTVVGEYNADEMIYEMMNPRTDSPYGLSPLESLILIVTSSLKATMYNLDYLTAGNVPEGLLKMPDNWSQKQIEEFMSYFDALVAGNSAETSKMKPIPGGSDFVPTKKRDDMAFREFNEWLMMITCGCFDIQPHEIGFTMNVNRATGKEQNDIATRRSIAPLANLLKEVWDDIIQIDLGYPTLQFKYVGLEDRDMLIDAQTKASQLGAGWMTIDEIRKSEGLDPIGIDTPYVNGNSVTFLTQAKILGEDETVTTSNGGDGVAESSTQVHGDATQESGSSKLMPGDKSKALTADDELKRLEKYAVKRIKLHKAVRPFESDILPEQMVSELNSKLAKCGDANNAKTIIDTYRQRGTPYFLAKAGSDTGDDQDEQDYEDNPHFLALLATPGFRKFERDFAVAIGAQAAWTATQIQNLEAKYISEDMPMTADQKAALLGWLDTNMPAISDRVDTSLVAAWYEKVVNSGVNGLYDAIGSPVSFSLKDAAYLAKLDKRASTLLTKSSLDATTRKQLANLIVRDREEGKTISEIADDILGQFDTISKTRAKIIARQETISLLNQSQFDAMTRAGVTMKEWINYGPNPCPICMMNAGDGPIPMDGFFSSGDLMPSAHIGCECGLDYQTADLSLDSLWNGE